MGSCTQQNMRERMGEERKHKVLEKEGGRDKGMGIKSAGRRGCERRSGGELDQYETVHSKRDGDSEMGSVRQKNREKERERRIERRIKRERERRIERRI